MWNFNKIVQPTSSDNACTSRRRKKKKIFLKGSFRLIIYKFFSQLSTFCASCSAEQIFKHWVLTERRETGPKRVNVMSEGRANAVAEQTVGVEETLFSLLR